MNSDFPQNKREIMEARLTALLLGELHADEIAALSQSMEKDPELAALYERLKVTIQLVRESASSPAAETAAPVAPLKLSEERREKLLAQFKTVAPKEFAKPRRVMDWVIPWAGAAAVVMILAALVLPALRSAKTRGMTETRLDNPGVYRMAQSTMSRTPVNGSNTKPSPTAPQTPALLPSMSSARKPETAPSTTIALENKSIPNNVNIVLSKQAAVKGEDVPVQYAASRDINSALVELTNASPAGQLAYGGVVQSVTNFAVNSDSYSLQTQYHRLSQQATEPQQGELALNYTNIAGEARGKLYDEVPATGILSKRESQATFVDGQIYAGTTREDLNGIRYLSTNGVISQSTEDQTVTRPLAGKGSIDTGTLTVVPKTEIVLPPEQPPTVLAYNTPMPTAGPDIAGAEAFAEKRKIETPPAATLTTPSPGVTVNTKFVDVNSNNTRALGFDWYLGNKLKPNGTIVASGGTAPSVAPTNWYNGNGATVRGFYDDNAALALNQTARAPAGAASAQGASILRTRTFKVDPNTFYKKLQAAAAEKPQVAGSLPEINGKTNRGLRYVTGLDTGAETQIAAIGFLRANGVNWGSNDSFFFNDREGIITVRATPEDLDKIEAVTGKLNAQAETERQKDAADLQTDTALPKPALPPPTPQPEVLARENAFSTFSLNVSDVSFKLAAASLEKGKMPEPASIRSEEFINAFDYRDPDAAPGVPIAFASERAAYPFAHNRELLRFSLKTAAAGRQAGRPLNIVLLLDNSGSMERADRVSIIREALRVLAAQLQPSDTFSIVTFARTARLRVDGVPGSQAAAAAEEIAKLTPEGGTNLGDALDVAYETARHHYLANGDNRVVLLTDGAANLGDVQPDTLQQKVEAQRQQGIALDCFGIGWEGYNDDLLEVLTRHGDGRYGFINTPEEANTEFVSQIAGALHVAAADVKVQVEFNPKRVTSYRQIGYAKHQLTKEQFRDNTVDAAEIAAQEAGNALYTIETNPQGEGSIATVRVRYKVPGTAEYREQAWDVPYTGNAVALEQASPAMRLAATASAFSEWLATSPFAAEVSPDELLKYLNGVPQVYGADQRPAKLEWMIRQAKSISGK